MIAISPVSTADLRPLDEDDFARLEALLDGTGNENAMVVEEIDGFLAALACVPDAIGEEELLENVLGSRPSEGAGSAGEDADTTEIRAEIGALLQRHAARVVASLDAREFGPVLSYDEEGNADGVAWAVGFLRGVELHPDSWDAMLDEKEFDDALDAMQALAAVLEDDADADDGDADDGDENDADDGDDRDGDDERAGAPPASQAERDALIDTMIGDVADIHEFFRPWREAKTTPAAMRVETVRRTQPKVGRNDPCPCGSGRKYKQCCGAG